MEKAARIFQNNLGPAMNFLAERGIGDETAMAYRLGVVSDGVKGYEQYVGRLAIPYIDRIGICSYKFRCLAHSDCKQENCKKYLNPDGQELGLFNVLALDSDSETLHICEGEIDTIILSTIVTDPVIGLPTASLWRDHWPFHLAGFDRVCVWPDGDKAGSEMAKRWQERVRTVEVMRLPAGHDVNSVFCSQGAGYFVALLEDSGEE
jgi:DNA primase